MCFAVSRFPGQGITELFLRVSLRVQVIYYFHCPVYIGFLKHYSSPPIPPRIRFKLFGIAKTRIFHGENAGFLFSEKLLALTESLATTAT
jgi:hypothetical protein